jgi:membrane-bound lytic murein transglycosylase A
VHRLAALAVIVAVGCGGRTREREGAPVAVADASVPVDSSGADAGPLPDAAVAVAPPPSIDPPCPPVAPHPPPPIDHLKLTAATWADLPAWADDRHAAAAAALRALVREARRPRRSRPRRPRSPLRPRPAVARRVRRGRRLPPGDDAAARAFFEHEFAPWQAAGKTGPVGKMTAYFVQPLRASRTRHDQYQYPIYRRPPELVMIDWSKCSPTGRGRKEWGRLDPATQKLVPLPTRAEIRAGAFAGRDLELLWVDDAIDELFLRIQGSGRAILDDGTEVWVEYDGKNGQPYTGPARLLRNRGELPRGQGTMAGIRAAFAAHGDDMHAIIDGDASMVFFKLGTRAGAIGSQDVILTPQRSAAVDRNFIAASPRSGSTPTPRASAPAAPTLAPPRHRPGHRRQHQGRRPRRPLLGRRSRRRRRRRPPRRQGPLLGAAAARRAAAVKSMTQVR